MNTVFRKLSPSDLELALGMNRDFREGFCQRKAVQAFLKCESNWLFAAVRESRVIGFAYGYELPRLDGGSPMLYLHEVGVMEAFQRRHVGTRMLESLKEECRWRGIGRFFLFTARDNAVANGLYQKLGGEVAQNSGGCDTCYFFRIQSETPARLTSQPNGNPIGI